jgi:two-component system phosphate regulon response regulator PhoB
VHYQVLVIDTAEHRLSEVVAGIQRHGFSARGTCSADAAVGLVAHDQPTCIVLGDLPEEWVRSRYCQVLRRLSSGARAQIFALGVGVGAEPDGMLGQLVDSLLPCIASGYCLAEIAVTLILASARKGHRLRYGRLSLDLHRMRLSGFGASLGLNPQITAILGVLMREPELVHSRSELLLSIPGERMIQARSIDVYVRRLRMAAEAVTMPDPIETIHTRGYRIARHG